MQLLPVVEDCGVVLHFRGGPNKSSVGRPRWNGPRRLRTARPDVHSWQVHPYQGVNVTSIACELFSPRPQLKRGSSR